MYLQAFRKILVLVLGRAVLKIENSDINYAGKLIHLTSSNLYNSAINGLVRHMLYPLETNMVSNLLVSPFKRQIQ